MDELARDLGFEYSTASADIDEQARIARDARTNLTTLRSDYMQSADECRLSGIQTRIGSFQRWPGQRRQPLGPACPRLITSVS